MLLSFTGLLMFITTCRKDTKIWLTETGDYKIDSVNVILNGAIVMEGQHDGSEYGFNFSANTNPILNDSVRKVGIADGLKNFSTTIMAMAPGNL